MISEVGDNPLLFTQGEHESDHVPTVKHEVQGPRQGWGGEDQGRL